MFEIFNYSNNFHGISIDRDKIHLGDTRFIEKLKSIKLDLQIDDKYILAFNSDINELEIKIFCSLFNEELKNTNNLSDIFKKFNNLFTKIEDENLMKMYYGLLCELIFIYHCEQRKINISKYYQSNDDKFDFNVNGTYLEIKKISGTDGSIIISDSQIKKLDFNDNIVCVELTSDTNGNSLEEIYRMISLNNEQKSYIEKRIDDVSNISERVNINKTNFKLLNKKFLPTLDDKFDNLVMDAKYKIFCLSLNKDNDEFFNHVKDICYGK